MTLTTADIDLWLDLEEGSGTPVDSKNGATITNAADWDTVVPPSSVFAHSLKFTNANSDYLEFGATTDYNNASGFVAMWVRLNSVAAFAYLASKADGGVTKNWMLYNNGSGVIGCDLFNAAGTGIGEIIAGSISDNTYAHIAFTWGAGGTELFVNGSSVGTNTYIAHASTNDYNNYIGRRLAAYMSTGYVAQFILGNIKLSSANVAEIYNSSVGITYSYFSTGTKMQINIGDAWKVVAGMQINIGDVWKTVVHAQINIGDAWKTIF